MEVSTDFSSVLVRLKQAVGANSDSDLAKKIGYSQQSIAKAKNTGIVPTSWIPKVSLLFDVSTDWLFFGRGPMRPGDAPQPAANAPEPPVTVMETATCARCAKMEVKLEKVEQQRDELVQENRELWRKNGQLAQENGDLKIEVAVQREQLKSLSGRSVVVDCA